MVVVPSDGFPFLVLSIFIKVGACFCRPRSDFPDSGSVFWPGCGPSGLSDGRQLPHHVHSCAECMDVDVYLCINGHFRGSRTGLENEAGTRCRPGLRTIGCDVYILRPGYRILMGETNLGHVLDLGCPAYFRIDTVVPVFWLHRIGERI